MPYSIQLCFDEKTNTIIMKMAESLDKIGVGNPFLKYNWLPHMALNVFDEIEIDETIKQINQISVAKVEVLFSAIGAFSGNENVLFLQPKITSTLLSVHQQFYDNIQAVKNRSEYYSPCTWMPHCAFATEIPAEKYGDAFRITQKEFKPFTTYIESVCITKFRPTIVLYKKEL